MSTYSNTANKTIEETAFEIGVAVGMSTEKARSIMIAFGDGIRKGMEDSRPLEVKVVEVKEAVLKGVKESADIFGKTAGAFGDGLKKGINDAKPYEEKVNDAGETLAKTVTEGVNDIKSEIQTEKNNIEDN